MHHFDDLDLQLLSELKKDSSISVPILSKKLGTNSSVIYSRIKRLIKKKLIKKYTIEIDEVESYNSCCNDISSELTTIFSNSSLGSLTLSFVQVHLYCRMFL